MNTEDVMAEFRAAGALREGHFVLSSGLHSPVFLQKNLVFMHADRTERLCRALADKIRAEVGAVDVVISPAVGRASSRATRRRGSSACRACTSNARGEPSSCAAGSRWSRGRAWSWWRISSRPGFRPAKRSRPSGAAGGEVVAAACIVDRSGGEADVGVPLIALAKLKVPAFEADKLPPGLAAIPIEDPGSRRIRA
jgi:orotate phosphoribosyltransferase